MPTLPLNLRPWICSPDSLSQDYSLFRVLPTCPEETYKETVASSGYNVSRHELEPLAFRTFALRRSWVAVLRRSPIPLGLEKQRLRLRCQNSGINAPSTARPWLVNLCVQLNARSVSQDPLRIQAQTAVCRGRLDDMLSHSHPCFWMLCRFSSSSHTSA